MMYRKTTGEKIFDVFLIIFFIICAVIMIFPFYTVLMTSLVSRGEYFSKPIVWWPEHIELRWYKFIFQSDMLMDSVFVTIFITVVGTIYSMLLTTMLSYALSKEFLPGHGIFMTIIIIPMFFGGGLIPYYLLIKSLHLINTVWVMILPVGVSIWNFLVMKSFFSQMPASLEESAEIDGASYFQVLWHIVLPLSLPVLATFSLFYGVDYWNTWWSAQMFVTDPKLHPLQLVLRRMVVLNELPSQMAKAAFETGIFKGHSEIFEDGVRMATVIISIVPIVCVYPFLQKYFTQGVLIGAVKE